MNEATVLPMGRPSTQTFALSAGEAVLGLLIERPGNSYQVERRLEGRFGSAQFAHGTAYHALKRLARQGLIRPVASREPRAAGDVTPRALSAVAYEATNDGVAHFEDWLRASISTPPVREELHAKIAFSA